MKWLKLPTVIGHFMQLVRAHALEDIAFDLRKVVGY